MTVEETPVVETEEDTVTEDDTDVDNDDTPTDDEPATYSAEKVRELRDKNARYRNRAHEAEQRADAAESSLDAARRELFQSKVKEYGKLKSPTDLEYDLELLTDPEKMIDAIDDLINSRPELKVRRITGDVGQGYRGTGVPSFNLMDTLKSLT